MPVLKSLKKVEQLRVFERCSKRSWYNFSAARQTQVQIPDIISLLLLESYFETPSFLSRVSQLTYVVYNCLLI